MPALGAPAAEGAGVAPGRREKEAPLPRSEPEKRSDLVFLEAESGAAYVGLETLSVKRDVVPTSSRREDVGPFVGAMAGAKLLFLSVGPHFRMGHFRDWDVLTLDLALGWHAPLGAFEPFLRFGGGYARLTRAFEAVTDRRDLVSHGYHFALTLGGDYFFGRSVTLGPRFSAELLALHRAGVNLNSQDGLINDYLKYDGASLGVGFTGAVALGLHF